MTERAYLLLGSNEGDRIAFLQHGIDALARQAAKGGLALSGVYETAAWGLESQPAFLNVAARLDTDLSAMQLLEVIREAEAEHGRQRIVPWGQRTLDIDILLFGAQVLRTEELTIPHPRLEERRFALAPLAEIAGSIRHPVSGISVKALLEACEDDLPVSRRATGLLPYAAPRN